MRLTGLSDMSRTKRPRNTKIGRRVAHITGNKAHQFQCHRSKVKVTKLANAETGSVSYLPNGKAYERQTWYTDGVRRPTSPTSAITTNVKGEGRYVTWCVWHRERKAPETPKSVGRLHITRTIMNTTFKVIRQWSRPLGWLMVTQKVRHVFWMKRPTNLKLDKQLKHEGPQHGQTETAEYVKILPRVTSEQQHEV